ncbi:hypothetical protein C0213_03205 [Latilactobacillus sakei]|nr:hypothetical protein [Latilactobacillus sakei]AUX11453.1 hypothetical protein C0213_03205 [Latilactobacillus sakei]
MMKTKTFRFDELEPKAKKRAIFEAYVYLSDKYEYSNKEGYEPINKNVMKEVEKSVYTGTGQAYGLVKEEEAHK